TASGIERRVPAALRLAFREPEGWRISMSRQVLRRRLGVATIAGTAVIVALGAGVLSARQQQQRSSTPAQKPGAAAGQKVAEAYTKKILDGTRDKRILTELVDHMPLPVDPKVPSPLKVLGYIPGEGGRLTYSADVYKYLEALDTASARVTCWSIGK